MRLSGLRSELAGWAYYFGKTVDPEVFCRVGNAKTLMTCIEIGDLGADEGVTLGSWSQPWEIDDAPVDDTGTVMVDPSMS